MDITEIILGQHHEQRRLFGFIQEMHAADGRPLGIIWDRLRALLDAHAEAEERFFYPKLLKQGSGAGDQSSAASETRDAIKDHNEIRDAAEAVGQHEIGSCEWFDAVAKADLANSKHMSEEERQSLADFRRHSSLQERHELGISFLAFVSQHLEGVRPVDKDPGAYVQEHQADPVF